MYLRRFLNVEHSLFGTRGGCCVYVCCEVYTFSTWSPFACSISGPYRMIRNSVGVRDIWLSLFPPFIHYFFFHSFFFILGEYPIALLPPHLHMLPTYSLKQLPSPLSSSRRTRSYSNLAVSLTHARDSLHLNCAADTLW